MYVILQYSYEHFSSGIPVIFRVMFLSESYITG